MCSDIRNLDIAPSPLCVPLTYLLADMERSIKNKYPPLEVLPCANINVVRDGICEKRGNMACSACKLVSYCSKDCQKVHWVTHKRDCKNAIRSSNWKPGWIVQGREPSFLTFDILAGEFESQRRLSPCSSIWGNVPAMDIVNLPNNENDLKKDLSLAFVASGDIRNVIATVNALAQDYSGQLGIMLNDRDPSIASRNIVLLLILGTIPDETLAADIALHFWYSVLMPMDYRLRILSIVSSLLMQSRSSSQNVTPLGAHSTLTCHASYSVQQLLVEIATSTMSPDQAQAEYRRVRNLPSRADLRDRMYVGLKPSHRLAFLEYRRYGIILPFGAPKSHYNASNSSLFLNGIWLQTDYADPLESWDLDQVFRSGKAHGAQPEDVYGCLYFHVSDQLRAFSRYIHQHRISFHVFNYEACSLAQGIAQGKFVDHGVLPTARFDRIDVSNIMDKNYVGIRGVMHAWTPLLTKSGNAALTGYFMNWAPHVKRNYLADVRPSVLTNMLVSMERQKQLGIHMDPKLSMLSVMDEVDAWFDNSSAFFRYWKDHGGTDVKLQLKTSHKVLPHRIKTSVGDKPNALPHFADDESWYRYTRLTNLTWTERFVELCHKS